MTHERPSLDRRFSRCTMSTELGRRSPKPREVCQFPARSFDSPAFTATRLTVLSRRHRAASPLRYRTCTAVSRGSRRARTDGFVHRSSKPYLLADRAHNGNRVVYRSLMRSLFDNAKVNTLSRGGQMQFTDHAQTKAMGGQNSPSATSPRPLG